MNILIYVHVIKGKPVRESDSLANNPDVEDVFQLEKMLSGIKRILNSTKG